MARKFKIGDKCKIVKKIGYDFVRGIRKGQYVTIVDYDSFAYRGYPYVAQNKKGNQEGFKPQELELVERKSK